MGTKRQKIVEEMQEKDKERRKKQPERKYHGIKGKTVPGQKSWHHPLPEGYKEGSTKGKKSTVGGGKQGVKTVTPEHMKAPKKKSKSSTVGGGKQAVKTVTPEHMKAPKEKSKSSTVGGGKQGVKTVTPEHMKSKSSTKKTRRGSPTSFTEKAGVAQDIGPWKPTDRKATKPKVSYKKPKKIPFGMKKGGSVDAQWGGYNFKDGGRIPGIRPTRKGT